MLRYVAGMPSHAGDVRINSWGFSYAITCYVRLHSRFWGNGPAYNRILLCHVAMRASLFARATRESMQVREHGSFGRVLGLTQC